MISIFEYKNIYSCGDIYFVGEKKRENKYNC